MFSQIHDMMIACTCTCFDIIVNSDNVPHEWHATISDYILQLATIQITLNAETHIG